MLVASRHPQRLEAQAINNLDTQAWKKREGLDAKSGVTEQCHLATFGDRCHS